MLVWCIGPQSEVIGASLLEGSPHSPRGLRRAHRWFAAAASSTAASRSTASPATCSTRGEPGNFVLIDAFNHNPR